MRAHRHQVRLMRLDLFEDARGGPAPFRDRFDAASTRADLLCDPLQVGSGLVGKCEVILRRLDDVERHDPAQYKLRRGSLSKTVGICQGLLGERRTVQWNEDCSK